jgi:hypothetical protein
LSRFQPGQSGNPSGRPKETADLRARFRALTPKAIAVLEAVLDADNIALKDKVSVARLVVERTIPAETASEQGGQGETEDPVSRLATILRRRDENPETKDLEDFQAVAAASTTEETV